MRYWALFSCSGLITLAAYGVTESAELPANAHRQPAERTHNFPPALVNTASLPTSAVPQALPVQAMVPPIGTTSPVFSPPSSAPATPQPVPVAVVPSTVTSLPPGPTFTLTPPPAPTFTVQQPPATHVPLPEPAFPLPTWSEESEGARSPVSATGTAEALALPHASVLTLATAERTTSQPLTEAELQRCQAEWTPLPWRTEALTEDKVESNAAVCAGETNELAQSTPDAATAGTPIPGRVVSPTLNKPFTGVLQPGNVPLPAAIAGP